ncbi:MAG: hypothetical protein FWG80_02550 [Alphaproteobacteria bacterium]|nr:hypothetical protein [Alphaproteobacteria bacterium]
MKKEFIEHQYNKMLMKRNFLFKAFLINYLAVFLVWLITITPIFDLLMALLTSFSKAEADAYIMILLGIMKIAGFVIFLAPAFAAWWEMNALKKIKK